MGDRADEEAHPADLQVPSYRSWGSGRRMVPLAGRPGSVRGAHRQRVTATSWGDNDDQVPRGLQVVRATYLAAGGGDVAVSEPTVTTPWAGQVSLWRQRGRLLWGIDLAASPTGDLPWRHLVEGRLRAGWTPGATVRAGATLSAGVLWRRAEDPLYSGISPIVRPAAHVSWHVGPGFAALEPGATAFLYRASAEGDLALALLPTGHVLVGFPP